MKKYLYLLLLLLLGYHLMVAQVYIEKQTRHRFAQLNLGFDIEASFGGSTTFVNSRGILQNLDLANRYRPRFIIGGTHFWGHADIYIAIPLLNSNFESNNQKIQYLRGVETVFKAYPWKIKHNTLRPYLGVSIASFYYEQSNDYLEYGSGPELNHTNFPLLSGFTFNHKNHLLDVGITWNYNNQQEYHISRTDLVNVSTPPIYANIAYRFMIETTQSAEKNWESGRTKAITDQLAAGNKLNDFYIGVGMSSAFWLGESSYNTSNRPYMKRLSTSIMPDFTLGYYLNNQDINFAIGYRGYSMSSNTYGVVQFAQRRSFLIEATKYLFDYHGFVPFIGPVLSYERLQFIENYEGARIHNIAQGKIGYGATFGWDIRPNRLQSWILRTNLRWYPLLNLTVENDQHIAFSNLEFNFIQLIIYPQRMFGKKG